MRKQTLISLLLLCFACYKLAAQPYQLTLSINVNPPYSADYTDYFSSLNQISVTIINSSPTEQNIYLAGSISTTDGNIFVRSDDNERWPGSALIIPSGPSTTTLNGTDLRPFAENSNVDYGGITPQDIVSGLLPEGDYRVCLRAFDYNNYQAVSADHCSNTFTIAYPPPPALNTPECDANIARTSPQNILFNWLPRLKLAIDLPWSSLPTGLMRYRLLRILPIQFIPSRRRAPASCMELPSQT
jgi:TANFOR domain-containing protein